MGSISSLGSTVLTWSGRGLLGPILPLGSQGGTISLRRPHTPPEQHVVHGSVNVAVNWVPTVGHQTIDRLHGFSPLSTARHSGPSAQQGLLGCVTQRPCLGNGAQPSCGHLFSLKPCTALRESRPLLLHSSQFPSPLALLTKNILCPGGQNKNFCPGWRNSDSTPG